MKNLINQKHIIVLRLERVEALEECSILPKVKEGDNLNHRNTVSILRIAI